MRTEPHSDADATPAARPADAGPSPVALRRRRDRDRQRRKRQLDRQRQAGALVFRGVIPADLIARLAARSLLGDDDTASDADLADALVCLLYRVIDTIDEARMSQRDISDGAV